MTWFGNAVRIKDGPNLDAFSRLRTSHPSGLMAVQNQYDAEPLIMEAGATGTGVSPTHNADNRMVSLTCTAGSGTSFVQSYEYVPYQPGKSQLAFITGRLEEGVAGAVVDVGLFDSKNGIFFRQNGTTNQVVRRTSTSGTTVDNAVSQDAWNLDALDGTGKSGLTLDVTRVFILVIDAQFLGMGRVRIGFDIDGEIVYVHEFLNANLISVPYMQTLSLPVQMLLTATSTASSKTCRFKCASVSSEGGRETHHGYEFATPEMTVTAASGAQTHILSVRPRTTFNSIENRSEFRLDSVEVLVTGANEVLWQLCVGSTFSAGPTFANINATYSAFDYTSVVGTLSAAGIVIHAGYCAATNQVKETISKEVADHYPLTLDRAGAVRANGTLSLLVTGIGGTSATRALMNFTEIR